MLFRYAGQQREKNGGAGICHKDEPAPLPSLLQKRLQKAEIHDKIRLTNTGNEAILSS